MNAENCHSAACFSTERLKIIAAQMKLLERLAERLGSTADHGSH